MTWISRDRNLGFRDVIYIWEGEKPIWDKHSRFYEGGRVQSIPICVKVFKRLTGINIKMGELKEVEIKKLANGFNFTMKGE